MSKYEILGTNGCSRRKSTGISSVCFYVIANGRYYVFSSSDGKNVDDIYELPYNIKIPLANWLTVKKIEPDDFFIFPEFIEAIENYFN